ncbi:hypothetical protein EYF80_008818 [Liparis tanakae]|uniref:Uncharacterized protein n=1 Tax=Liparis tanakae TaxID=230148 RepID=A0A4Z2IUC7_9TELE|nr:hypothetical protein EYF80_008818 [Liparis tanakae]
MRSEGSEDVRQRREEGTAKAQEQKRKDERLERSAKAFPHWAQPKGFSPVCERMWPCKSQGRLNAFPHTSHLCLRSCVSRCMAMAGMDTYTLLQVGHFFASLLSSERCVCLCRLRLEDVA